MSRSRRAPKGPADEIVAGDLERLAAGDKAFTKLKWANKGVDDRALSLLASALKDGSEASGPRLCEALRAMCRLFGGGYAFLRDDLAFCGGDEAGRPQPSLQAAAESLAALPPDSSDLPNLAGLLCDRCAGCGRREEAREAAGGGGGGAAKAFKRCSACKAVKYCGGECQRADWARHKRECPILQKH